MKISLLLTLTSLALCACATDQTKTDSTPPPPAPQSNSQQAAEPQAAEMTYYETVAECNALFAPLLPVTQVQKLIKNTVLAENPHIDGNRDECSVWFREKDWAPGKRGSATPLAMYSVYHGASTRKDYVVSERMTISMSKAKYASVDAKTLPGVEKAYSYSAFGRHWLVMLTGSNSVTVQVRDSQTKATLHALTLLVLKAIEQPALQDWRQRQ